MNFEALSVRVQIHSVFRQCDNKLLLESEEVELNKKAILYVFTLYTQIDTHLCVSSYDLKLFYF